MPDPNDSRHPRGILFPGIRLGRIANTEVVIDWSLLIIFALITASLGAGVFPRWHPNWSPALSWFLAIIAAILFFMSVLMHELSHVAVARAFNLPAHRITLFLFGGLAQIEEEPPSPRVEFYMAIMGPLVSIAIGLISLALGAWFSAKVRASLADEPLLYMQSIGPVSTLLLWLGPINLLLGVFNLIPGFPLDGGRVLRSIIWWTTNDMLKATAWAAAAGKFFAWIFMAIGIFMAFGIYVPILGTGLVSGLWLILIGWFLNNAAHSSYQYILQQTALKNVPVTRLMHSHFETVPANLPVDAFVEQYLLHSDQRAFPVVQDEHMMGLVGLDEVKRFPREIWSTSTVQEIMTPMDSVSTITPQADARQALDKLANEDVNQLPVIENGHLLGLIRRQDILKWLVLHQREATT
jgi:Zn-dependent protease/CBS domain-containing protein